MPENGLACLGGMRFSMKEQRVGGTFAITRGTLESSSELV